MDVVESRDHALAPARKRRRGRPQAKPGGDAKAGPPEHKRAPAPSLELKRPMLSPGQTVTRRLPMDRGVVGGAGEAVDRERERPAPSCIVTGLIPGSLQEGSQTRARKMGTVRRTGYLVARVLGAGRVLGGGPIWDRFRQAREMAQPEQAWGC